MTTIGADIEQEIVERLEASEAKDEIIFDLCNRLALDWRVVEAEVERVGAENATHITLGQSPLLVMLALVTFLGGIGLAGYSTFTLVDTYEAFMEIQNENTARAMGGFLVYLISNSEGIFWSFIFGAGMIVGSLQGMHDVWVSIFDRLAIFQNRATDG